MMRHHQDLVCWQEGVGAMDASLSRVVSAATFIAEAARAIYNSLQTIGVLIREDGQLSLLGLLLISIVGLQVIS